MLAEAGADGDGSDASSFCSAACNSFNALTCIDLQVKDP
jgi:hypothetical protein